MSKTEWKARENMQEKSYSIFVICIIPINIQFFLFCFILCTAYAYAYIYSCLSLNIKRRRKSSIKNYVPLSVNEGKSPSNLLKKFIFSSNLRA